MSKIRVHQLAKELNITVKILIAKLSEMNIHVKSHMSRLDDDEVLKIRAEFSLPLIDDVNLLSNQVETAIEIPRSLINTKNNLLNEINVLKSLKKHLTDEIENLKSQLNNLKVYKDSRENTIMNNKTNSLDLPDFMKGV